ncbi:MAG: LPS assembly lipoprotein LptE [Candidatus Eremiobacteraeota bacterium]|nr:LPS assembly lipoprotein LptE [Candidatus Eremiobacteraeota bacterium]
MSQSLNIGAAISRRTVIQHGLGIAALVLAGACRFSPYHFAGGGLPPKIRTIAVLPFDNQTPIPELQRDLFQAMRDQLQRRLNLRDASENKADAIVRGVIVKYDSDVPIGYSADPRQATQSRRQLQLVVDVAIIDQATGLTLFEHKALAVKADYAERAESQGRAQAIQQIVTDVIEGAQSNW